MSVMKKEQTICGWGRIYKNQEENGKQIMKEFDENEKLVGLVLKAPQAGKTGLLCACIQEAIKKGTPIENIFIITGLSSLEWKEQTSERLPKVLRKNVYHRPDLKKKFMENFIEKEIKDVLILIDEVQIACNENQTICNVFNELNLFNFDYLEENMIKIVQFSATPNGTLYDISNSEDEMYKYGFIKTFKGGEKYTGIKELYETNRIKQALVIKSTKQNESSNEEESLNEEDYTEYLNQIESEINKYKSPKYHFIRIQRGEKFEEIIHLFCKKFPETTYELYTQEGISPRELDERLMNQPDLHTFIFIKDRARCAKTFSPKEHIGLWYERCNKITCDDVIIQGLVGRACGYDDNEKEEEQSVIYTNVESIKKYIELMESDFEAENVIWKSSSTFELEKGKNESKGTLNGLFGGDNNYEEYRKIDTLEFKSFEETCSWVQDKYKGAVRKFKKTTEKNGFYNGGSAFKYKPIEKKDIIPEKVLLKSQECQLIRCYNDINDPESLVYIICYRN